MPVRYLPIVLAFFLFKGNLVSAQTTPFTCANLAYQITAPTGTANSTLFSFNVADGLRANIATLPMNVNASGYNQTDNLIWAVNITSALAATPATGVLTRIDANGVTTNFTIPNMPKVPFNSGDISSDGYYYFYQTGNSTIYVIDLNPARTNTYLKMVEPANKIVVDVAPFGVAVTPTGTSISDFAYNQATGMLISVVNPAPFDPNGNGHKLVSINPVTGVATFSTNPISGTDFTADNQGMGAIFYDGSGTLYGYTNGQGFFYRIDNLTSPTPTAVNISSGGSVAANDGMVCPSAVLVTTITGNVFNDTNGLTDNTVNGTGINPGGLFAILYDVTANQVAGSTTVAANGTYSFNGMPGDNYRVVLTTTTPAAIGTATAPTPSLPSGWAFTGDHLGAGAGSDGAPNGILTLGTLPTAGLTNANFGIAQPPTAVVDNLAGQPPGSAATIPNILANDTDPNSGTLSPDSISLVVPSGATGITTDAQGDTTGFTVPGQGTWALNSSTGAVTFTPQSGFTGDPTPISYTVTDASRLSSNPATITIDYNPPVTVSGTVYNDNDGQTGGPNGTPMPAGTTVTLYAANGTTVIATTTTDANGNYNFPGVVPGSYAVGVTPPAGYQNVSSTDATPTNGLTNVNVGSTSLSGVNFGLNQPPATANDLLNNQTPGSPATVPNLLGNDTDPNGGTLSPDSISLVAPTGATGITTDAQGDITGFTVPGQGTWALNPDGSVTFTPQAGFTADPTPIGYTVTDAAGLSSLPATITIDYIPQAINVSGTVYDDNNGATGGPDGTPLAGATVTLYAADGTTVIATTTTDANGSYNFPNVPAGNYQVQVTPPAGYQNVSSTDGTPQTPTPVTVGATSVSGVNFGVNEPPTSTNDLLANQTSGTSATVPNLLGNDTDPNGGPLSPDSISLIAPSGATGITVDAQGDITSFTVPGQGTWTLNNTTGALTFTPQAGFTGDPTPISYTVTDAAGLTSNSATITIGYNPPVTVSGTVYNDNDGTTGGPNGTLMPAGTVVTLYAADGTTVIATTNTDANGNYSFPGVVPGDYVVGVTPPAGYQNVSSTDATPTNGLTSITVGDTGLNGVNFGLNQPPAAGNSSASSVNPPVGNTSVPVAPVGFSGTDPNGGIIDSLRITGFPTNTTSITIGDTTYYPDAGSVPAGCTTCAVFPLGGVTVATTTNGQPTVAISVDPSGTTATTVVIPYTVVDNAGLQSPIPGSLTLPFNTPLPVKWLSFTATASGKDVLLSWATVMEENTDYFEAEYATDGSHFHDLAQVAASGNSAAVSNYNFKHNNAADLGVPVLQYRIRQVDRDGCYTYSEICSVRIIVSGQAAIRVYPNPVAPGSSLTVIGNKINDVQVFNASGNKLWSGQYKGEDQVTLPVGQWAGGTYLIRINGEQVIKFLVK